MQELAMVTAQNLRVRALLERQVRALEVVAALFEDACAAVPRARDSEVWRGDAHRLYVLAVESLTRDLAAADTLIRQALAHSRRAVNTMADRAG